MTKSSFNLRAVALAACCGALLVGCGGGSDSVTTMEEPTPQEMAMTAYEAGIVAIGSATTKEAANEAYETALDNEHLSEAQENDLERAFNAKNTELDQVAAMTVYEAGIEAIGSATTEAAALTAYDMALENEHLSAEQRELLRNARDAKNAELDTVSAMTAYDTGIEAIGEAADKDAVQAAYNTAIANEHLTPAQATALENARDARNAHFDGDSAMMAYDTGIEAIEEADDRDAAQAAYNMAIANEHLTFAQKNDLERALSGKNAALTAAKMMADVTADNLKDGISARSMPPVEYEQNQQVFTGNILVGDAILSEDDTTTIATLGEWGGKRYAGTLTETNNNQTTTTYYEANVYSNQGETEDLAFDSVYNLESNGELVLAQGSNFDQSRVDFSNPGTTAGLVTEWDDQAEEVIDRRDLGRLVGIKIPGSYYGVSGNYLCVPEGNNTCAARYAGPSGFELGIVENNRFNIRTGAWEFVPNDPKATVNMPPSITNYASYGWWIQKTEKDGEPLTASAFATEHGNVEEASGLNDLNGTAKYVGGAAGKYAFSPIRGSNDAGHFTATAELRANFTGNTIDGDIYDFIGADGQTRNWKVELNNTAIEDAGTITSLTNGTTWIIDGTSADPAGEWGGTLWDNEVAQGYPTVPRFATGTFRATHDEYDAEMVGAFGANRE